MPSTEQTPQQTIAAHTELMHKQKMLSSMHIVFGGAIIILALVVIGIVCALGNVPIPYLSSLYAPEVEPPSLVSTVARAYIAPQVATSTVVVSTTTVSKKK